MAEVNAPAGMPDLGPAKDLLERDERVRFAYLFGSRARGKAGPLSDTDIAVFLDPAENAFDYRLLLIERLSRALRSDRLDLVVLSDASPELKFAVIKHGKVLKEDRSARVPFEARTISEYLDTQHFRNVQREGFLARVSKVGFGR